MKTTRTFDFPLRWAAPGLVTGLLLLSGVVAADDQKFPATGQTTCYDILGAVIPCTGTGQDGDIQAGATLRYRDNGNGTIRDRNTGLTWEKKSDDGTIHDRSNIYAWDEVYTMHIATLNTICANDETVTGAAKADCVAAGVGGRCGFAGKRDWRVPNIKELQSIVNYEVSGPSVSPAFNINCVAGATVLTGSCTTPGRNFPIFYWSSTTKPGDPEFTWGVLFDSGGVVAANKRFNIHVVRAVRGGL